MYVARAVVVAFLMLQGAINVAESNVVKEITHEDIRDAILSLLHQFRDNTDKLERHELRERQLGEQLKKAFTNVEKKQNSEEVYANSIMNLLHNISKRLETLENVVAKADSEPTIDTPSKVEELLQIKFANLEQAIQTNKMSLQTANNNVHEILNVVVSLSAVLNDKTAQQTNTMNTQLASLQYKLQDQITKLHETVIEKTQDLSNKVAENLRRSVNLEGSSQSHLSADSLQIIKNDLINFSEREINKLQEEIGKSLQTLTQEQDSILATLTNSVGAVDSLNLNVKKNYEHLLKEMKGLSKIEQVLIQTADNVLDIKRRIEYGSHEVLLEVTELIKEQNKDFNSSVNKRFDGISFDIQNSQNGALANLSSKIETEISQVWRQIGTMYQTLTNSADTLDKLQQHTEIYVNGSLKTLDHMEGKVGQITSRMTEVDDNLNYLLGRLSLVTQEFSQIRTGLGEALDKIKGTFTTVQSKVKDVGPGPNPIEEDAPTYNSNLLKSQYTVS
ncbi:uncharacterized protein LOC135836519 [Planococcus citri]|uniref:uncharacterized protein LOC135836519 n=1 Tax=Planococcus citri TaxID=170843 RepID=UPI0031F79B08